jgi:ketosteroid isomerase-like protein
MAEGSAEVVRRFFTLDEVEVGAMTDEALGELFDPQVEWVPLPQGVLAGNSYVGFDGIRRFWRDFFGIWDKLLVEPQEIREVGDRVAVVMRMRGKLHELEIDELWSSLFTLRAGRIARVQSFATPEGAHQAAGRSG